MYSANTKTVLIDTQLVQPQHLCSLCCLLHVPAQERKKILSLSLTFNSYSVDKSANRLNFVLSDLPSVYLFISTVVSISACHAENSLIP